MQINKKQPTYEIRIRAIKAKSNGMRIKDISKAYQVDRSTVDRWIWRDKEDRNNGLERKKGSGRKRILGIIKNKEFLSLVFKPATEFGYETDFWTSDRVKNVLEENYNLNVSRWTVWRQLKESGLTYQKPERHYFEASEELRQQWKKKELPRIRRSIQRYKAILYCQDESTIRLTAVLAKTWSPRGKSPKQTVTGNRASVAAMSAISQKGRLLFQLYEKRIASDEVIGFLQQMLNHHKRRHLVVVMDHIDKNKRVH